MARLLPRQVFLGGNRRPTVVFFTSSRAKFVQAQLIFESAGLNLSHRINEDRPYRESYSGTKEDLLAAAIKELRRRGGAFGSYFFIEDTSIRIEALSTKEDYPGLEAKEWFERTSFEELDRAVSETGDRRAVIRSCIALAVPRLARPLYFYGETEGLIALKPEEYNPDPLLPWLSPNNFSAWFIPNGASRTLSEMSFEESLDYDFRVRSLMSLIDRLEEYALAMNGPSSMYSRSLIANTPSIVGEPDPLFPVGRSAVYLVVGPPCAGKTTMGMYGLQNLECQVVDASAVVRSKREEMGQSELEISEFARRLLSEEGPDIIARSIAHSFSAGMRDKALIVTGFRAIEEIQFFRESFLNVKVISVEASARVRYERYLRRGTRASLESYEKFRDHDAEQRAFGLLGIAPLLTDVHVRNVYSKETFYRQAEQVFDIRQPDVSGVVGLANRMDPETSQLYRCLTVLRTAGRPLTTQEIQRDFEDERFVLYNNANKILKRYPELAKRQESSSSNVRYHITQIGLAFLAAIDWLHSHG